MVHPNGIIYSPLVLYFGCILALKLFGVEVILICNFDSAIGSESISILPSCITSSSRVFLIGSLAARDGEVLDNGYARRVMISSAIVLESLLT